MKRLLIPFLLLATPAAAHTGHGPVEGAIAGFAHPFTGVDHLLAMTAVGLLAGLFPRLGWRAPAAFMGAMLLGFLSQALGGVLPVAELVVAASVAVLGAGMLSGAAAPVSLMLAATALFGLFHGYVHGVEAGGNGMAGYGLGFLTATAALHAAGFAAARRLDLGSHRNLRLATGGVITAAGLALVAAQAV